MLLLIPGRTEWMALTKNRWLVVRSVNLNPSHQGAIVTLDTRRMLAHLSNANFHRAWHLSGRKVGQLVLCHMKVLP